MTSPKFTLNRVDAYKGIQMFVITSVVMSIGAVVLQPDFDVFSADWITILKTAFNTGFVAAFSYLVKNYFTSPTV